MKDHWSLCTPMWVPSKSSCKIVSPFAIQAIIWMFQICDKTGAYLNGIKTNQENAGTCANDWAEYKDNHTKYTADSGWHNELDPCHHLHPAICNRPTNINNDADCATAKVVNERMCIPFSVSTPTALFPLELGHWDPALLLECQFWSNWFDFTWSSVSSSTIAINRWGTGARSFSGENTAKMASLRKLARIMRNTNLAMSAKRKARTKFCLSTRVAWSAAVFSGERNHAFGLVDVYESWRTTNEVRMKNPKNMMSLQ